MYAILKSLLFFLALFTTLVTALPTAQHLKRDDSVKAKHVFVPTTNSTNSTTSSDSTTSTDTPHPNNLASGGGRAPLFPQGTGVSSWSTAPDAPHSLPLSDATFKISSSMSSLSHSYVAAPDGKKSMRAVYPKGSYRLLDGGGISFYAQGPGNVDLTTAKEVTFGYSVFFPKGFAFNMGGKLPGLYGGDSDSEARGCSGGRRDVRCFSARLMWRTNGAGEMYTYLPPGLKGNTNVCHVGPKSICNPTYGASVGRGSYKWATGQWTTVSQRVKLNDVGQANGELEMFVGGKSVFTVSGLTLRDSAQGRIRGIQMETFFGGHTSNYASPKSQDAYFSDFSMAILDKL